MKKYIAFAVVDSWHLANGVHFPFGEVVERDSIIECLEAVKECAERRKYRVELDIPKQNSLDALRHYFEFKIDGREGCIMIHKVEL